MVKLPSPLLNGAVQDDTRVKKGVGNALTSESQITTGIKPIGRRRPTKSGRLGVKSKGQRADNAVLDRDPLVPENVDLEGALVVFVQNRVQEALEDFWTN